MVDIFKIDAIIRAIEEHHEMNIYRHNKNGLLYTLEKVSPRMYTGSWVEATPYNHKVKVYPRKKHVDLKEFILVAVGATG